MPLDVGSVFRFRDFSLSYTPHRYVVLHKPDNDHIVITVFSSQLENVKKYCRKDEIDPPETGNPRTYIEVSVNDCPAGLICQCAVNCNRLNVRSIAECESDHDFNDFGGASLATPLVQQMRNAVQYSKTVDEEIKDYFK